MNKISKTYVGVDVSKKHLDVYLHPEKNFFRIDNSEQGIKELERKLNRYTVGQVVCESTGGYETNMIMELTKANYKVWRVDPTRVKAFRVSEGQLAKTDALDAKIIALFASQKQCKHPCASLSQERIMFQGLVKRKLGLTRMISNEKKRLKNPEEYCEKLIKKHIEFMEEQIASIDKKLAQLAKKNSKWSSAIKKMVSVPGVGIHTANVLLATMPELGRLNKKQAAALAGVAPYANQSGAFVGRSMIYGGRPAPRTALYMAALTASRYNVVLAKFYQRLRDAGKTAKVAFVAVMRKLIGILNAILRDNTTWVTV